MALLQRPSGVRSRQAGRSSARPHVRPSASLLAAQPCSRQCAPAARAAQLHNASRIVRVASTTEGTPQAEVTGLTPDHPYPWEEDYDLLGTKVKEVTDQLAEDLRGCNIWLVGMMGSGKSTVGKMLANTLKYAFFDTDSVIELAHDKRPVSSIFQEEGQEYFRKCESQIIKELSPYRNLVIATGGGAVLKPENWGYMHMGVVVWLHGDTALLARRVARDGIEKRPLLLQQEGSRESAEEAARNKLLGILDERRKYYENADVVVDLQGYGRDADNGAPTAAVMYRLLLGINEKVQAKKAEKEARMNFKVENAEQLKTMRTVESPAVRAREEQQQQQQ